MENLKENFFSKIINSIKPSLLVDMGRMFYSIAVIYGAFYFVFHVILKRYYHGDARLARLLEAGSSASPGSALLDGLEVFILPSLLLLLLFAVIYRSLFFRKRPGFLRYFIKAYVVTEIFSFISLKISFLSGAMGKGIHFFSDMQFSQISGFLLIYSLPLSLTILVNRESRSAFIRETVLYLLFVFLSGFSLLSAYDYTAGAFLFSVHNLGLLYFIGTLISVLSIFDGIAVEADVGFMTKLFYLVLPALVLVVVFPMGAFILYGFIGVLFGVSGGTGLFEIFTPFEHVYFYFDSIAFYQGVSGFIYSFLSLCAVASVALTLYKKKEDLYDSAGPWEKFRSAAGWLVPCWLLSRMIPLPWYAALPIVVVIFSGFYLLFTKTIFIKRFVLGKK